MTSSVLFSVVIPTFNRRDLLRRTLESLRTQRFTDFETIIVDDGSTDGTGEYLARSAGRARVIQQANRGPGAARNAGVAAASGKYVAFLDSDDMWFPWTLSTFARVVEDGAPLMVTARYVGFSEERLLNGVPETPVRSRRFDDFLSSSQHPVAPGSGTLVIERSTFLASGGFTDRVINGEDLDLALRLGEARGFVQILEPIVLAWRRHAVRETENIQRSVEGMRYVIEQERAGKYPGGHRRAAERRRIITRQVRPITFACLRDGRLSAGMRLYSSTLAWHGAEGRWAYLGGFPIYWAGGAMRSGWRR